MTIRLINECFDNEELEEKIYSNYLSMKLNESNIIVVDPYMINIDDLVHVRPRSIAVVRARRPAWGKGDLGKYIFVMKVNKEN